MSDSRSEQCLAEERRAQVLIDCQQSPVPNLEEQCRIVVLVGESHQRHQRISSDLAAAQQRTRASRQVLLTAAFSGKHTGHVRDVDRAKVVADASA